MPFPCTCPTCSRSLNLRDELKGRRIKCPKCGDAFTVPGGADAEGTSRPRRRVRREESSEEQTVAHSTAGNFLGLAALSLGALGFVLAWVPGISVASVPLSGLGFLLGIAALVAFVIPKKASVGYPLAGSLVSLLALVTGGIFAFLAHKSGASGTDTPVPPIVTTPIEGKHEQSALVLATPQQAAREADWHDSTRGPVAWGDLRVSIIGIGIDSPKQKGAALPMRERFLQIRLRIEHVGKTLRVEYGGWGTSPTDQPLLTDSLGNTYRRINLPLGATAEGQAASMAIAPGQSISDLLLFDIPVEGTSYMRLTLPARQIGGVGTIRFQIPASAVTAGAAATTPGPSQRVLKLLDALKEEPASSRVEALVGLARLGPEAAPVLPVLIDTLRDQDEQVRVAVCEALATIGPPAMAAYPALGRAQFDGAAPVRRAAQEAQHKLGTPGKQDVPVLITALKDENPGYRSDAAQTLEMIGKEADGAVSALVEALSDRVSRVRLRAARALIEINGGLDSQKLLGDREVAMPKLIALMKDNDRTVRRDAAETLAQLLPTSQQVSFRRPEVDPAVALRLALEDGDAQVRLCAAEALCRTGPTSRQIVNLLNAGLHDGDPVARVHAACGVWMTIRKNEVTAKKLDSEVKDVVAALAEVLKDHDGAARRAAAGALVQMVPGSDSKRLEKLKPHFKAAVPALGAALKDQDVVVRRLSAEALGKLGTEARGSLVMLRAAASDADDAVRQAAEGALAKIGKPTEADVPLFLNLLKDANPKVRAEAALALGSIRPPAVKSIPELMQACKDKDEETAKNAANALTALGIDPKAGVREHLAALKREDLDTRIKAALALGGMGSDAREAVPMLTLAADDPRLASYAIASLGRIGKESVPALIKLLAHEQPGTRRDAIHALRTIGPDAQKAVSTLTVLAANDNTASVREAAKAALEKIQK